MVWQAALTPKIFDMKHPVFSQGYNLRTFMLQFALQFGLALCFICPPLPAQELAEQEEQTIRAAVEKVGPAVVRIETVGGLERVGKVLVNTGPTTGLVVS